jgi:hypothetical protein
MNGQKRDSLKTKMLMPIAPGYSMASNPAQTWVRQKPLSPETSNADARVRWEDKRITNPMQTAPSTQPAKRAAMIAVQVPLSPAGKSIVHGERNNGYNGARNILESGLPY